MGVVGKSDSGKRITKEKEKKRVSLLSYEYNVMVDGVTTLHGPITFIESCQHLTSELKLMQYSELMLYSGITTTFSQFLIHFYYFPDNIFNLIIIFDLIK